RLRAACPFRPGGRPDRIPAGPEIAGRPLSVVRCPDGLAGQCFFQKHHGPGLEGVGKLRLREESGRWADYLVVEDAADVMALVQMNFIEFHPLGGSSDDLALSVRIVFAHDNRPRFVRTVLYA